jgi:MFS family permease
VKLDRALRNPWWVVFGATAGMVVGNTPMTLFTFGLFLKPVTNEFGWSRATFASALFASQTMGAVSMPIVGKLIDRYGIRRVTLAFVVLFSAATALLSQTRSAGSFVFLYGVSGLAGSGRGPIAYTKAISAWFEARRGLALGIAMTGLGIGAALVPQIARLLIGNFGWRGAYVGLALIAFAVSFPTVALFIREPEQTVGKEASYSVGQMSTFTVREPQIASAESLIKSGRFWLLTLAMFLVSASLNGTFIHIVPLLTDRGLRLQAATAIVSLSALALMGGQLISGYLLDRFVATSVAGFFFLASVIGIILMSFRAPEIVATLGGVCLALGIGTESNLAAFLVSRHFGLVRFSETFGYVLAVSVLGNGLGPWLMALCYDLRHSYNLALGGSCLALIVAIFLISKLGPYRYPATKSFTVSQPSTAVPLVP